MHPSIRKEQASKADQSVGVYLVPKQGCCWARGWPEGRRCQSFDQRVLRNAQKLVASSSSCCPGVLPGIERNFFGAIGMADMFNRSI